MLIVPSRVDERCAVCGAAYADDPQDLARYVDTCAPCNRAEQTFAKRFGDPSGDADFIYHELAHFILRHGRAPRSRRDWNALQRVLDQQPVGIAQTHELRTLALQGRAYLQLGWKLAFKRLVKLSWGGLDEAARRNGPESYERGQPVVTTESAARRAVRRYCASVSTAKVKLLAKTIARFRGEAR